MSFQSAFEEKKKWRAHMARVKALPRDYRIVYKEIQNYLFKLCPVDFAKGDFMILTGLVELFEDGAAAGKNALDVTGGDVAGFCDDLIKRCYS